MTETRPMRADARRNREKLLLAATEGFAAEGEDMALEAIAARAGVGIGTLYRHFPTRDALIEAAYRHEVELLCAAAPTLLAESPPDRALHEWMARFAHYVATKRGMGGALTAAVAASGSPVFAETRERITAAIALLLAAGAEQGVLRPDVAAEDVFVAMGAVWRLPTDPGWQDQVRRVLDLLVDGLRHGAARA
jgi:AcrR family transcriptional regulator